MANVYINKYDLMLQRIKQAIEEYDAKQIVSSDRITDKLKPMKIFRDGIVFYKDGYEEYLRFDDPDMD